MRTVSLDFQAGAAGTGARYLIALWAAQRGYKSRTRKTERRTSSGWPESLADVLLFPTLLQTCEHLTLGLEPLVRVVFQHPPREVPGHRFDDVLRLASLE